MTSNVMSVPGPDKPGTGADLLRLAAVKLRKHADLATEGPWRAVPYVYGKPEDGWGEPSNYEVYGADDSPVVSHQPHEGGGAGQADAEYFALVHPPVAFALAEVLNRLAKVWSHTDGILCDLGETLARAVLREGES